MAGVVGVVVAAFVRHALFTTCYLLSLSSASSGAMVCRVRVLRSHGRSGLIGRCSGVAAQDRAGSDIRAGRELGVVIVNYRQSSGLVGVPLAVVRRYSHAVRHHAVLVGCMCLHFN